MGLFRTRKSAPVPTDSPAELFRDLNRSHDVRFLWGHQQRLLDEYHQNHLSSQNVALELPTGSGKTLVGLLIAEWRRQASGETVAYLCPTRQLCNQVAAQSREYGIGASLLVGPGKDYDEQAFTAYQTGQAIAITTYSGLFNTNPRISDPQFIICDDAHAGDEYISSLWSMSINRHESREFFQALVDFLSDAIAEDMRRRIRTQSEDPIEKSWVDLVPSPLYRDRLSDLADVIDHHSSGTRLAFPWQMIRGHLEACNIYVSPNRFLIRPYIPPTETHRPFMGAVQRVFMSATLGEGGELERITGVRKFDRLPILPGWERRGTGRRLILFPDLLQGEGAGELAIEDLLLNPPRSLYLVRGQKDVDAVSTEFADKAKIYRAADIEGGLREFTADEGPALLVLANRYEGIDLPGHACRQMVISGLPASISLQEAFLLDRLGAVAELRDRIRTRLTQGIGRCTRDETDFAVVYLVGGDLLKWCATESNTRGLHPELRAEIDFGHRKL